MPDNLINQGLTLMLVGMGTVFLFLTVLVMGMSFMAAIVARIAPAAPRPAEGVTDEEIAAITAAIALHRTNKS